MTAINRNNFLRWTGAFIPAPYHPLIAANSDGVVFLYIAQQSTTFNPFTNAQALLGINTSSFEILSQSTPTIADPSFDGIDTLTMYAPVDNTVTSMSYTYRFYDNAGNVSNEAYINVTVIPSPVQWIGYPPSYICRLNPQTGQQFGMAGWNQLVLVYNGTTTPVMPLTLQDNIPTNPYYIPDVQDIITCTGAGALYVPLKISNLANRVYDLALPLPERAGSYPFAYITIRQIDITYSINPFTGTGILHQVFYCNIGPGISQVIKVLATMVGTAKIAFTYTIDGPGGPPYNSTPPPASNIQWLDPSENTTLDIGYQWYYQSGGGSPIIVDSLNTAGSETYTDTTIPYPNGCSLYIS